MPTSVARDATRLHIGLYPRAQAASRVTLVAASYTSPYHLCEYVALVLLSCFWLPLVCGRGPTVLAEHDAHLVLCAIIIERNFVCCLRHTVHFNRSHAATQFRKVL